ncbi:MAG: hypothetical protein JJE39_13730, partial [Vicinamibacteria bacterium]|nr:hypothetical protein [Vicinamibacteria bacterium]
MEERRLILAFALSFAVLLGFRMWTNARYPPAQTGTAQIDPPAATVTPPEAATMLGPQMAEAEIRPVVEAAPVVTGEERRVEINTAEAEIAFSSRGARLLSWKLLEYKDERGKPLEAHPGSNPLPGPLDIVTGNPEVDARLRAGLFRVTDVNEGPNRGARFEFSDGSLVATKTIRSIKEGRAFR